MARRRAYLLPKKTVTRTPIVTDRFEAAYRYAYKLGTQDFHTDNPTAFNEIRSRYAIDERTAFQIGYRHGQNYEYGYENEMHTKRDALTPEERQQTRGGK